MKSHTKQFFLKSTKTTALQLENQHHSIGMNMGYRMISLIHTIILIILGQISSNNTVLIESLLYIWKKGSYLICTLASQAKLLNKISNKKEKKDVIMMANHNFFENSISTFRIWIKICSPETVSDKEKYINTTIIQNVKCKKDVKIIPIMLKYTIIKTMEAPSIRHLAQEIKIITKTKENILVTKNLIFTHSLCHFKIETTKAITLKELIEVRISIILILI